MSWYRFRFDSTGAALTGPQPAAAAEALKAGRVEEPGPSLDDSLKMIDELARCLEEDGNLPLDMSLLEAREILLTPPHWSFVADAARGAVGRTATQGPPVSEDQRQAIRKYAEMLRAQEPVLGQVLAAVAYTSRASLSTDPLEQVRDALKAFPKRDMDWMTELPPSLPTLPPLLKDGKTREWTEAVRKRHEEIRESLSEFDWVKLEEQGWATWRRRFQEYRRGRPKFDVDLRDVLLRTRGVGPATLFRNDLGAMSLKAWSEALIAARRQEHSQFAIPLWVTEEIGHVLFGERRVFLIVVGQPENSVTDTWLPSKRFGCFWIDRADWKGQFAALTSASRPPSQANRWLVAVELAGEGKALAMAVQPASEDERLAASVLELLLMAGAPPTVIDGRQLAYIGREKLPPAVTPSLPYLENPKGVDAVVQRLEALIRPA